MERIPADMRKYLLDKGIKDVEELAKEAEEYASHRENYWKQNPSCQYKQGSKEPRKFAPNQQSRAQPYQKPNVNGSVSNGVYNTGKNDNQRQHQTGGKTNFYENQKYQNRQETARTGTRNAASMYRCEMPYGAEQEANHGPPRSSKANELFIIEGTVEGKRVGIYRDSGCEHTAVDAKFVPQENYLQGQYTLLKGINGVVTAPIAEINIDCQVISGKVRVAVLEGITHDVLLGQDIDTWSDWLNAKPMLVMTRAQKAQEIDNLVQGEGNLQSYENNSEVQGVNRTCRPTSQMTTQQSDQHVNDKPTQVNSNDHVQSQVDEQANVQGTKKQDKTDNLLVLQSDVQALKNMQKEDDTLQGVRDNVVPKSDINNHNVCFYKQADILMRKWVPSRKQKRQVDEQIIVPKQYRQQLIEIAHDKAGHMGIRKTTDRITAHFFWPGIFAEVRKYCQNCSECQYKSMVKNRQFLQPMPILDTPLQRVGIDIVGPLPVTEKGNRCMLTVCDYATRYPEAIPLPDQKASTVANALITVFSRVGLPSEIIHDQGTNFMSHVVKDMCSRLGIQQIPTTPYHQQMNGMTERFHETLKLMIKSLTEEQKVNWDDQIPLFLFSYREVPCEATGYSPFHLLYGREIRGPLSLIKEGWLEQTKEPQNVAEHLLEMSANLTKWMASARANKEISQKKMKYYYDKHAQDRTYQVGEEVLVFLPEGAGKLDSKWQGPYKISKKIGDANYEIIMPDKRKSKRVLHANLCKKWYSREHTDYIYNCYCVTGVVQEIGVGKLSEEEDNELETQFLEDNIGPTYTQTQTWKDTTICESVSQIQKKEMSTVLKAHSKAFSDVPGRTNVISHTVKTTSEVPIRQRAYRTPHALKQKVKEELDSMLRLGVSTHHQCLCLTYCCELQSQMET
ncbi:uncharacterized protein [Amphiura filiformis]|uniref:uncharacterized protein n=1 Tax=Amphiura filiformis TaxID=82378 RepID=UPI003B216DAC